MEIKIDGTHVDGNEWSNKRPDRSTQNDRYKIGNEHKTLFPLPYCDKQNKKTRQTSSEKSCVPPNIQLKSKVMSLANCGSRITGTFS